MSEREQIDCYTASYMCDVVESFTHLDEVIDRLRWRMLRCEPVEMWRLMHSAKKHARALKARLDGLEIMLDTAAAKVAKPPTEKELKLATNVHPLQQKTGDDNG